MRVLAALAPDQVQVVLGRQLRDVHSDMSVRHCAGAACRQVLTSAAHFSCTLVWGRGNKRNPFSCLPSLPWPATRTVANAAAKSTKKQRHAVPACDSTICEHTLGDTKQHIKIWNLTMSGFTYIPRERAPLLAHSC